MRSTLKLLVSLLPFLVSVEAAPPPASWQFVQNGTTGILALETVVVSPTLVLMFDRVENDPLQLDGAGAWVALWNLETNTASPVKAQTNTFCASGAFLSNGTMVSAGGSGVENPTTEPDPIDGHMGLRLFDPCESPDGSGCTLFEDIQTLHLAQPRWYPSTLRIFDGSVIIAGGIRVDTPFYNTDPINTFEFFPKKDGGVPRNSPFLEWSLPANLFPRAFALPDGKVFFIANNRSMIYDVETGVETRLPDIPNGVRVTNPLDGTATLLPLHPPLYTPEVLVCGGQNNSDTAPLTDLSSQDPASDQCSRITLTAEGIEKGWSVERMPEGRIMPEAVLLPDGHVLIINGGQSGYAAIASVQDPVGNSSNSDHPALTPVLYNPDAASGQRFSSEGMPTTDIPRLYHSSVTLTAKGNLFIAGSNPNELIVNNTLYHTEWRAEYLNPPYMQAPRPAIQNVPKQIPFDHAFTIDINIPAGLNTNSNGIKVALMDLGFSTHAFHHGSRLVFLDAQLSADQKKMTIITPPNNRVYPPGPGYIFVTIDGVPSEGVKTMIGNGQSPPVQDQGRPLLN